MGIFEGIKQVLGLSAEADATRAADPDDLFGMSTAYLTMMADLGFEHGNVAALCFSNVDSTDFQEAIADVEEILQAGEEETGTVSTVTSDDRGYEWVVLEDQDPEDLVTTIHFAADTFVERGYGSRLLAAVFAFHRDGDPAYWIYSFRRGSYYPFAPRGGRERDTATEFKLQSVLDGELEIEADTEYWYPLWPSTANRHPWE